jgi:8-oxo-dGTP pyrophosphatase MutT (NUDIX family)
LPLRYYLSSQKKPQCRIFPKGYIEPGESAVVAAKRELLEEAGVQGEIIKKTDTVQFEFRGKWFRVTYFLFHFIKSVSEGEKGRDPHWYTADEAHAVLPFDELKTLLHKALCGYSSI